jgi:hypothetical protein
MDEDLRRINARSLEVRDGRVGRSLRWQRSHGLRRERSVSSDSSCASEGSPGNQIRACATRNRYPTRHAAGSSRVRYELENLDESEVTGAPAH